MRRLFVDFILGESNVQGVKFTLRAIMADFIIRLESMSFSVQILYRANTFTYILNFEQNVIRRLLAHQ